MRASFIYILAALCTAAISTTSIAGERPPIVSGGIEVAAPLSDADDGYGAYVYYQHRLEEPISLQLELNVLTGDYKGPALGDSGTYNSVAVGLAFVVDCSFGDWDNYIGAGGAYHLNDFDGAIEYDDKLSIFFLAGGRLAIGENTSLDLSARYRSLRADSKESFDAGELELDAIAFRIGISKAL